MLKPIVGFRGVKRHPAPRRRARGPRRVAVGEFDGVHLGHREVIRGADTVLTFEPHPLAVVRPEAAPKLLTTPRRQGRPDRRARRARSSW